MRVMVCGQPALCVSRKDWQQWFQWLISAMFHGQSVRVSHHSWVIAISEKMVVAHLVRNSPSFMESQGSLRCSQEPTPGPCPESDESRSQLHIFICVRIWKSILVIFSHLLLGLPNHIFPLYLFFYFLVPHCAACNLSESEHFCHKRNLFKVL